MYGLRSRRTPYLRASAAAGDLVGNRMQDRYDHRLRKSTDRPGQWFGPSRRNRRHPLYPCQRGSG